jgi:hypothetical protein
MDLILLDAGHPPGLQNFNGHPGMTPYSASVSISYKMLDYE